MLYSHCPPAPSLRNLAWEAGTVPVFHTWPSNRHTLPWRVPITHHTPETAGEANTGAPSASWELTLPLSASSSRTAPSLSITRSVGPQSRGDAASCPAVLVVHKRLPPSWLSANIRSE